MSMNLTKSVTHVPRTICYLSPRSLTLTQLRSQSIFEINQVSPLEIKEKLDQIKAGQHEHFEARHLLASGEIRDVEIYAAPIAYNGQNIVFSIIHDITDRMQAEKALEEERRQLQQALDEVRTLRGIVPICAHCKKIRDDKGYWNQVEKYVSDHTEAKFSHGICPDCAEKILSDIE